MPSLFLASSANSLSSVAYALVDEEPQILGVHLAVQLGDQGVVAGLRIVGQIFQIEADAAIARVGGEEGCQLVLQVAARRRILQHAGHTVIPFLRQHVVVLKLGIDLRILVRGGDQVMNLVLRVDAVDPVGIHDVEDAQGRFRREGALQLCRRPWLRTATPGKSISIWWMWLLSEA